MRTRLNAMMGMVLLLVLVGCGAERAVVIEERALPEEPSPQTETWTTGGTGGVGVAWVQGLRIVVMYAGTSTGDECHTMIDDLPSGTTMGHGCVIPFADGGRVVWDIVSPDGETGSITINGTTYAIPADGTVFTVDSHGSITAYQRVIPAFAQQNGDRIVRPLLEWLMSDPDFAPYVSIP